MSESEDMPEDPDLVGDDDDTNPEQDDQAETNKLPAKKKNGIDRSTQLAEKKDFQEDLMKVAAAVEVGYRDQIERSEEQAEFWDIYECILNDNQCYSGNAQAYIGLAADAVDARQVRFTGKLCPNNGRYVEVVTEDGEIPFAEMALLEYYIEKAKIRTEVIPALCKNGDVEGQYNIYVDWRTTTRHTVRKETTISGDLTTEDLVAEVVEDGYPVMEPLPDSDVCVLPATANSIHEALEAGGSATITRRWSEAKIQQLIDSKDIIKDIGEGLSADMRLTATGKVDIKKAHVSATGIKAKGKWFLARETWHKLEVDGEMRIVKSYFGADAHTLLGTKLNPNWSDKIPIFSAPVKKQSGAFKGTPPIKRVAQLTYLANDFLNQAADSATYALMPIVMTDPEKNPKIATMILDLAAVWETNPNDTKFAEFPPLWQQGFELIAALKAQIQQSLSVNPSMIAATNRKSKPTQADIANQQAVDTMTSDDSSIIIEEGILTPAVEFMVEMDMQYRHDDKLIPMFGMMGKRAKMERIPPLQQDKKWQFKWLGIQASRNAAQTQQGISFLNVLKGIPPQMYRDHRIDATAIIEQAVEQIYGPRVAPLTFISLKDELSIPQEEENKYLEQGIMVPVAPMDDDADHLKKLAPLLQRGPEGDPTGNIRIHAQHHMQQQQQKALQKQQEQMMAMQGGGQPGQGGPREGAQAQAPRGGQGPAGQISQDQMPRQGGGVVPMPRAKATNG